MRYFLLFILVFYAIASCSFPFKKRAEAGYDEKIKMMDADKAFSESSLHKGVKIAFLEYIDSNGVLLRPNQYPLIGADAIDFLSQQNDTSYTLQWKPQSAMIAQSGELGFTYGVYQIKSYKKDTTLYGTYVSVWKKQADGNWKFVLDSGNEGLGELEQIKP